MIDHDRLFKELLSTFFAEFIELFLPQVTAYLDRDSIQFLNQEIFTDVTSGERREVDVLAQVRFLDQDTCFLIHLETQSATQSNFARRMFHYFARLGEKYNLPIYPVVVFSFDSPQRPEPNEYRVEFPDRQILSFNFTAIQLNRLNWRDYLQHQNPVAAALMAKMQIQPSDRPKVKAECLRLLATLRLDPARTQLISGFIDTYLKLTPPEKQAFESELDKMGLAEQEQVMEIVTSWMQEGIERGIKQGIEQGIKQGEANLVLRLLNRRLGNVPAAIEDQIRQLTTDQLENLGEALLDFSSEDDLTNWLNNCDR